MDVPPRFAFVAKVPSGAMRTPGFMCGLLISLVGSDASVVPAVAQEAMTRPILRDVAAHDLAQGVDAVGHRFERAWKLELLEDAAAGPQKRVREAVRAAGVRAPATDDITLHVHSERPRAHGARHIDRRVA